MAVAAVLRPQIGSRGGETSAYAYDGCSSCIDPARWRGGSKVLMLTVSARPLYYDVSRYRALVLRRPDVPIVRDSGGRFCGESNCLGIHHAGGGKLVRQQRILSPHEVQKRELVIQK